MAVNDANTMINDLTPIIVGVGQVTELPEELSRASSPVDLMVQATDKALLDAGVSRAMLSQLDQLAVVRSFRESTDNTAFCLARRLNALQSEQWMMPHGGNGPQYLVNRYFESIANGENTFVLLSGAEAMNTSRRMIKAGVEPDWSEPVDHPARYLVAEKEMSTEHEKANGAWMPSSIYPLFENALRGAYGESIEEHQQAMGELFARFSAVAANSPTAWYPQTLSASDISEASADNRYVGWPYTKRMNAMNQINQSASLLLCSVGFAREAGISEDKWVFLHGCADVNERHNVSDRVNYYSSPAINVMAKETCAMANMSVDDLDYLDIYSCFPVAVEIARDELGIRKDDPRSLTLTGGLPFHGGAGNNYVMNAIATMVETLRAHPKTFGLVTANGGYLTKHAAGIYSTTPTLGHWRRKDPASYQCLIDDMQSPPLDMQPSGEAIIETYTVTFGRDNKPNGGIIVGRLGDGSDPMAPRFFSSPPDDAELLLAMTRRDYLGAKGIVVTGETNIFTPDK